MLKTTLKKGLPLLWLGLSLGYSSTLWAANGEVRTNSGTKEFFITLTGDEMNNNVPGGQTGENQYTWDFGEIRGTYRATIYCDRLINNEMHYYTTTTSLPASDFGNGFLKLNDYLDVKILAYIGGRRRTYFEVPFLQKDNNYRENGSQYECRPPRLGGIGTRQRNYLSGSRGKVVFRVRKPIINGISLQQREIIEMYGQYGKSDNVGSEPMARVIIESAIISVPDKCVINSGELISVEFGTLPDDQLDGSRFKQPLALNFRCEGGSFSPGTNIKINMAVSGNPANFSPSLLKTDRENLGIAITENNQPIDVNRFYPVQSINNTGLWNLIVAPISKSGTIAPEGEFNAAATIVAQFD